MLVFLAVISCVGFGDSLADQLTFVIHFLPAVLLFLYQVTMWTLHPHRVTHPGRLGFALDYIFISVDHLNKKTRLFCPLNLFLCAISKSFFKKNGGKLYFEAFKR